MLKLSYLNRIATQMRRLWNLLVLQFTASPHNFSISCSSGNIQKQRRVTMYKASRDDDDEEEECAVCLCAVEEGEEIGELRCDHVFHGACLDQWSGLGSPTCPLCRDSIVAPPRPVNEAGQELLLFDFTSLVSGDHRDRWWLR